MRSLKLFSIVAFVLVMVVAACGGGEAVPTEPAASTSATSVTTSGTEATAVTAVEVAEATAEPTLDIVSTAEAMATEAGEEDLSLDSVSGGLTQLSSYKSKLDMRFSGKDAEGQAVDNTWIMEEEFIQEPRAQRIKWSGSESKGGQPGEVSSYEIITIGQDSYMISQDASGAETCVMVSSSDATPPEQALSADMWGSISDARYEGTETVNGIRAKHYVWKEGALALFGFVSGKGETWVAEDGDYVVRQTVEATGKGLFLAGTDEEGTTTWEWNVTDINGSFQILPPEGCESAATDIPIMADATDKATFGDMISYTSASPFADVVTFYKTEMPNDGWQPSGTPTEMEGFSMLEFTKEERTASIMISFDQSNQTTSVVISVTKP